MLVSPLASVFLRYFVTLIFVFSFRFTLYSFQGAIFLFCKIYRLMRISVGGDNEIRTHDPLLARQVLSQLSYTPTQSISASFKDTD